MGTTQKYYPYGSSRSGSLPNTDKLFTGQRKDDTGLYYYGARYYDAGIGRFISADTIVPDPMNPQALNRYSYVLNNPLKYRDNDGHNPLLALVGYSVVLGFFTGTVSAWTTYALNPDSSTKDLIVAFGTGFVAGATGSFLALGLGSVLPILGASQAMVTTAQVLAYAEAGGSAYAIRQTLQGEKVNPGELIANQAISGLASVASGRVVPHSGNSDLPLEKVITRTAIEESTKTVGKLGAKGLSKIFGSSSTQSIVANPNPTPVYDASGAYTGFTNWGTTPEGVGVISMNDPSTYSWEDWYEY